jgi:uroporphyrin-III C-methyltransferase
MTVHLVGAGPGDPELMTVRAVRLLAKADVVVFDALVDASILDLVPPSVECIDVGKRPGKVVPQKNINALLVQLGRQYDCVVRLKGGDPYVFGRGGEEACALIDAGIDCEVVPAVSSAFSAPAAAGIPVTHRGVAPAVTVVTGHRKDGETQVNWAALAKAGSTLVVLMGVAERGSIAEQLMSGGLSADTAVAVIERATRADQRVVRMRLDELGDAHVAAPATIVIGAVAAIEAAPFLATTQTDLPRSFAGE